jgi:hypothetical protein
MNAYIPYLDGGITELLQQKLNLTLLEVNGYNKIHKYHTSYTTKRKRDAYLLICILERPYLWKLDTVSLMMHQLI